MPSLPPTTGAPLSLYVPPFDYGVGPNDFTYDVPVNDNWTILNNFAGTVILKNPTASQTVTQPAATYFNQNSPLIFGASAILRFGTAADIWDSSLTRTGAGNFTLDSNTPGDASAILKLRILNATTGYQLNGAAPAGHLLVGNGSEYVDGTISDVTGLFYQHVENNGSSYPQRPILNFISPISVTDNPANQSSDVFLANSGVTAGSYTLPNFTVDAKGRITAAANGGLNRADNLNGSYIQFPDGTLFMWGVVNAPTSGGTLVTAAITFPTAFTTTPVLTVSGGSDPDATNDDAMTIYHKGVSTTGATAVVRCAVNIGGSGAPALSNSVPVHWHAFGH